MIRIRTSLLLSTLLAASAFGQVAVHGPTDPSAIKTYAEAQDNSRHMLLAERLDKYRKADKQDHHHCYDCARRAAMLALRLGRNDVARDEAIEMESLATTPVEREDAYLLHGIALVHGALVSNKERDFADADSTLQKAIAVSDANSFALYEDGIALAHLHQDEAATARFREFCDHSPPNNVDTVRARRYISRPELARARMAPAFAITTLDGRRLSLDGLEGKVVLIDFWATWCGPCREALPRIQDIAKRFDGQPLVVLSVSLDSDDAKWRDFVAKHHMDWPQYRDGVSNDAMARLFGVHAIPATFTIDADGVLEDQHTGDAAIEGKLKKLVAAAATRTVTPAAGSGN